MNIKEMNPVLKTASIFLFAVFLMAAIARGANYNAEITFSYDDKDIDEHVAEGYNLYMDAVKVCEVQISEIVNNQFPCLIQNPSYGFHQFTLTADKANGEESRHSGVFPLMIELEEAGTPVIINIIINRAETPEVTIQ